MGLEKYGMSLFSGTTVFEIPFVNGKYSIGLDNNPNLKEKFETYFGVKFDTPEGQQFLGDYEIKINHDVTSFSSSIKDEFDLHVIKVNKGMGFIALSDESFNESPVNNFKVKLTDEESELRTKVGKAVVTNGAIVELNNLHLAPTNRILLIAKYLFPVATGLANNKDLAYAKLDEFIKQSVENAQLFLNTLKIPLEEVDLSVAIKDGIHRNIIRMINNQYVLYAANVTLGRS